MRPMLIESKAPDVAVTYGLGIENLDSIAVRYHRHH